MYRYFNIHTHQSLTEDDCLAVRNVSAGFDQLPAGGYYSAGLHPWYLHDADQQLAALKEVIYRVGVLAIGECGLDKVKGAAWALQEECFRKQVHLAIRLKKPMIIHCVRAFEEVLAVLKDERVTVPVIFHGFVKKPELAIRLIDAGYYLSFGAALMRPDAHAASVLQLVPADRFFLETDDAAVGIGDVYHAAALARNVEEAVIVDQVAANFSTIWGDQFLRTSGEAV